MRRLPILLVIVGFVLGNQSEAIATEIPVYPTGNVTQDAANIQAALDNAPHGATIILKAGTFQFGDAEPVAGTYQWDPVAGIGGEKKFVYMTKNVTVRGERGPDGEHLTKIKGGVNAFNLGWDPNLGLQTFNGSTDILPWGTFFWPDGPTNWTYDWVTDDGEWSTDDPANNTTRFKKNYVIEDLWFENFTWNAIYVAACDGATIRNNRFTDGYMYWTYDNQWGDPEGYCTAISFNTATYYREPTLGRTTDISGNVLIDNNFIDANIHFDLVHGYDSVHGFTTDLYGSPFRVQGVNISMDLKGFDAQVEISNNTIINGSWILMRVSADGRNGSFNIHHNDVRADGVDPNAPTWTGRHRIAEWAGIQVGARMIPDGATFTWHLDPEAPPCHVDNNKIHLELYWNILSAIQFHPPSSGSTSNYNEIHYETDTSFYLQHSNAPIFAWSPGENVQIVGNRLTGAEVDGIAIGCWIGDGKSMLIHDNDLTGFTAGRLQVALLDTHGFGAVYDGMISENQLGPVGNTGILDSQGFFVPMAGIALEGQGNVFHENDYKQSGIPGIADDLACMLLGEASTEDWIHDSGGYPAGTDAKNQVLDLGALNRVVGHDQDELAQQEGMNPGIGQRMRDALAMIPRRDDAEDGKRGRRKDPRDVEVPPQQ